MVAPKKAPNKLKEKSLTLNQIVDKIKQLETSGGKNDKCIREGLGYNGYGYGQGINKFTCFDSDERIRIIVKKWFTEKLTKMDLATSVCYYNQGRKINNCKYWENFQSL